jgi:hypothetical protein
MPEREIKTEAKKKIKTDELGNVEEVKTEFKHKDD